MDRISDSETEDTGSTPVTTAKYLLFLFGTLLTATIWTIVFTTVDTKFIIHGCHSPIEFAVVAS